MELYKTTVESQWMLFETVLRQLSLRRMNPFCGYEHSAKQLSMELNAEMVIL